MYFATQPNLYVGRPAYLAVRVAAIAAISGRRLSAIIGSFLANATGSWGTVWRLQAWCLRRLKRRPVWSVFVPGTKADQKQVEEGAGCRRGCARRVRLGSEHVCRSSSCSRRCVRAVLGRCGCRSPPAKARWRMSGVAYEESRAWRCQGLLHLADRADAQQLESLSQRAGGEVAGGWRAGQGGRPEARGRCCRRC